MKTEDRETGGFLLGISSGWEEAADFLADKAAKHFRAGQDDEADLLRDAARECRKTSSERRDRYDEYKKRPVEPS